MGAGDLSLMQQGVKSASLIRNGLIIAINSSLKWRGSLSLLLGAPLCERFERLESLPWGLISSFTQGLIPVRKPLPGRGTEVQACPSKVAVLTRGCVSPHLARLEVLCSTWGIFSSTEAACSCQPWDRRLLSLCGKELQLGFAASCVLAVPILVIWRRRATLLHFGFLLRYPLSDRAGLRLWYSSAIPEEDPFSIQKADCSPRLKVWGRIKPPSEHRIGAGEGEVV